MWYVYDLCVYSLTATEYKCTYIISARLYSFIICVNVPTLTLYTRNVIRLCLFKLTMESNI